MLHAKIIMKKGPSGILPLNTEQEGSTHGNAIM